MFFALITNAMCVLKWSVCAVTGKAVAGRSDELNLSQLAHIQDLCDVRQTFVACKVLDTDGELSRTIPNE